MKIVVKARRSSQAAVAAGIFANYEVDIVDENGNVVARLSDGTLRKGKDGWWCSGPAKQVKEKWYRHWRLYPEADDANRNKVEQWVVSEILKQIPDPGVPVESLGGSTHPQGAKTNAPFGGGAPFTGGPQAATPAPARPSLLDKGAAGAFPFPT